VLIVRYPKREFLTPYQCAPFATERPKGTTMIANPFVGT
jgi:hypothetical protein